MAYPETASDTSSAQAPRKPPRPWLPAAVAVAITFLLFLPACAYPFVNLDDFWNVAHNPYLSPAVTAAGVLRFWRGAYVGLYSPVTFSIWSVCALFARLPAPTPTLGQTTTTLNAHVFHTAGVCAHALNVLTVFAILRILLRRLGIGDPFGRAAAVGALLFGIHPVQVESVAWITGNNNVFSATFGLAAIYLYLRWAAKDGPPQENRQTFRARRGGSLLPPAATVFYALALLAKPTATAIPLILIALEVLLPRRPGRRAGHWAGWMGLWVLGAVLFGLLTNSGVEHGRDVVTPFYQRPFVMGDALAFYLVKLVWPHPLCFEYDHAIGRVVGSWWGYATWLLPVGIATLLWRGKTNAAAAAPYRMGFALLIAGTLPMLGLIPYYFQPISTVADRYLYLALLGPALAAAALTARAAGGRPEIGRLLPLALAPLALVAAYQIRVWSDPFTLVQHTLSVSDSSYLAHNEMGTILMGRGDWRGAEREYRIVLRRNPDFELAHACLGTVLAQENRRAESDAEWLRFVHTSPDDADAQFGEARICFTYGRTTEALIAVRRTLQLRPQYPGAAQLLAAVEKAQALQQTSRR